MSKLNTEQVQDMFNKALSARENAKCQYSNFPVGACLLANDSKTGEEKFYTGCNVEEKTFRSNCAEQVAFTKAISEGASEFKAILIVLEGVSVPCGHCRQFISEFVDLDFEIYCAHPKRGLVNIYKIKDLLPHSFSL